MVAATGASTKTLFPVPIRRLIVLLPVLAVKTYFPALVDPAVGGLARVDDRRKRAVAEQPAWLECASVMTAVPSG